jgi:small-conductance mechanosensitive channel
VTSFRIELAIAIAIGLALGAGLRALRPVERASVRNALALLLGAALAELLAMGTGALGYPRVASIAANVASIAAGVGLIRLLLLALFRLLLPALGVHIVRLAEDLASAGVILLWGFVWLSLAGVDLASLVTTSAVITAVLAFAMQDTLGNLLGGIVLQLDGSMRVGDWVEVDTVRGRVTDVRWRYTAIETRNRETVYVPNSLLMKNRFTVIGSRTDTAVRWRRWTWFTVELNAPPMRVCAALERAVIDAEMPLVAREPAPSAVLMDVTEGCARYALRYWLTDPLADDGTDSVVRAHALAALERAGIRTAVRGEARLVMAEDEARRAALAAEEFVRRQSALSRVALFSTLSEAERSEVSRHLVHAPFVAGDVVTRKGAVAHWLYLIVNGEAEIVDEVNGARRHVAMIGPGDVFGERGLLTGEPRGATVLARSDLECYRLDKPGLEGVLHARPDIAHEMSRILESRAAELEAQRAAATGTAVAVPAHTDFLARIRSFFGLH